jgi:hypothetical protein
MSYDRTVTAYHGCDEEVARRILDGEAFKPSKNDYDWLGHGVYFWEYGLDRAYRFALAQQRRGKIQSPAVIGALVQLGECFDLMDTRFTHDLRQFFPDWAQSVRAEGAELPRNAGSTPDLKLRRLDCAVLNAYLDLSSRGGVVYDTVRCGFIEGGPAFEGSGIYLESHIQIAVRTPRSIAGVFRPNLSKVRPQEERQTP